MLVGPKIRPRSRAHMKNSASWLPALGSAFLKPGDNVINFYYSESEQLRFSTFLQEGLDRGYGVIVAGVGERHPLLTHTAYQSRLQRRRNMLRLQVTPNLHSTIASLEQAALALLQRVSDIRIAVDFDGLVSTEAIFENEAELNDALRVKRAVVISQYDGNAFPASVTMEQFQTHALTLVGDAFFSENQKWVSPGEYLRTRRKSQVAMAAAAAAAAATTGGAA